MTIGARIQAARRARGWTQRKLSEVSGYSITSISDWEVGREKPSERAVKALENAMSRRLRK